MAEGFKERMTFESKTKGQKNVIETLFLNERWGQKNSKGLYLHQIDKKGKLQKSIDPAVYSLITPVSKLSETITDQEIIERMMLPMIFESARCLEENIVSDATSVDMSMVYGLGFPPFRGGVLSFADTFGAKKLLELSDKYLSIGKLYEAPKLVSTLALENKGFY
jgi:3-hydroxyacyl-CoA dehydrogenase/enoyl-CoA hydratase/3-hydroxybutyryl-CoA epimerase/enoyl-CoA isomerase